MLRTMALSPKESKVETSPTCFSDLTTSLALSTYGIDTNEQWAFCKCSRQILIGQLDSCAVGEIRLFGWARIALPDLRTGEAAEISTQPACLGGRWSFVRAGAHNSLGQPTGTAEESKHPGIVGFWMLPRHRMILAASRPAHLTGSALGGVPASRLSGCPMLSRLSA